MIAKVIGHSHLGQAIMSLQFGDSASKHLCIIGGVHGDEIEGVALAQALVASLAMVNFSDLRVSVIPCLNPDGYLLGTRHNLQGVDLNRNLPSKDWTAEVQNPRYQPGPSAGSEPENKALMAFLEKHQPNFIISLHSFSRFLLNPNGDCEPIVSVLAQQTGYPVEESMGYPTPGCLGTFTGLEQGIPTLTYELQRGADLQQLIPLHKAAILQALHIYSEAK